jgi:hypothetical protein
VTVPAQPPPPRSIARLTSLERVNCAIDQVEEALAAVAAAYPGWHIWRSQAGRWWATRLGREAHWGGYNDGDFAMTIDADTLEELARELAYQGS